MLVSFLTESQDLILGFHISPRWGDPNARAMISIFSYGSSELENLSYVKTFLVIVTYTPMLISIGKPRLRGAKKEGISLPLYFSLRFSGLAQSL